MRRAAIILCFALAALPAAAADRLTLMLDWFVNPGHAPIVLAEAEGDFAAQGLAVEIVAPSDPALPAKLVAAGEVDVALSYQPQLHLMAAEGLPLRRIGTLIATPLNCLLVRADGPIADLADLRGRTIGYSVAGVEEAVVAQLLATVGLALADVEMVNVGFSLAPAVVAGQVDAVIGAYRTFELEQMRLLGSEGRCFAVEAHGAPAYDELIYVANADRIATDAAYRDRLRRFLAAVEAATQRLIDDPEAGWTRFSARSPELGDALNRAAWAATLGRFAPAPAALDAGRYRRFSRFLAEAGLIGAEQPVEAVAVDLGALD